jgi:serine/threonine protein kinase
MNETQRLLSPTGEFEDSMGKVNQYHLLKEIGSGSYGKVVLCKCEETQRYFACKIVSKNRLKKKFRWSGGEDHLQIIKKEVAILKKISLHKNVNGLVEVLDDVNEDNLYMSIILVWEYLLLVFELCEYGSIMEVRLNERTAPFSEDSARKYFRDVILGLEFCMFYHMLIDISAPQWNHSSGYQARESVIDGRSYSSDIRFWDIVHV